MKAVEAARGKWPSILRLMGIDVSLLDHKHHGCPKGEGKDRFRFADREGSGNFFCSCSDGSKGGLALLMCCKGYTYPQAAREVEKIVGEAKTTSIRPSRDPAIALNAVRSRLQPTGIEVVTYLASRGLEPTWPMRQAKMTYWNDGQKTGDYESMVVPIQNASGKKITYHVTYLEDGRKAYLDSPRKIMTSTQPISGGAIRLCEPCEEMGVSEGLETAMSATKLFSIPTWSCISSGMLAEFIPPPECKKLWIFGDNDRSYAGQAAAYKLAQRLTVKGIECLISIPRNFGDWNDVLMGMPK